MREMSRFSCPVRVYRDSECERASSLLKKIPNPDPEQTRAGIIDDSASLVPGDLIDLAYENLHTFPADVVLLSGDAIVNESMLTGESVPVSKVPIESGVVGLVSAPGGEIKADLSKHVLYNGTKIIRIRKTSPGGKGELEAVAMVLRTGGSTELAALRTRKLITLTPQASTRPRAPLSARCSSPSRSGESSALQNKATLS